MPTLHELPKLLAGDLPALLTVQEVAATLRVDASTIYRAVRDGRLLAVRLSGGGGTIRIPARVLDELLGGRTPQPKTKEAA